MSPSGIHIPLLLALADSLAFLLADRFTPEAVREKCLKFAREFKDMLPPDSKRDVEAAEARAIIRALAYRRGD
jgi:hypothetical protein